MFGFYYSHEKKRMWLCLNCKLVSSGSNHLLIFIHPISCGLSFTRICFVFWGSSFSDHEAALKLPNKVECTIWIPMTFAPKGYIMCKGNTASISSHAGGIEPQIVMVNVLLVNDAAAIFWIATSISPSWCKVAHFQDKHQKFEGMIQLRMPLIIKNVSFAIHSSTKERVNCSPYFDVWLD